MTTIAETVPTKAEPSVDPIPRGYRTITPYVVAQDGAALIDFAKQVFGAEEIFRAVGSAGGIHCEVRIGDSMVMMGGGRPGHEFRSQPAPAALHVFVDNTDAVYQRALGAGAESLQAPVDREFGERVAAVRDPFGNLWYIATWLEKRFMREGLRNVNAFLHPLRAPQVIDFLSKGLGGKELFRSQGPEGAVHHAEVRIGNSVIEISEARAAYQPLASMFYLYVPDVDAVYRHALAAGASSISEPADQPYGDRSAGVRDPFGHQWYIATHIKDVTP